MTIKRAFGDIVCKIRNHGRIQAYATRVQAATEIMKALLFFPFEIQKILNIFPIYKQRKSFPQKILIVIEQLLSRDYIKIKRSAFQILETS